MALSEEDRRRIEEEEFRRVARERALQSADPPPSAPSGTPKAPAAPNTSVNVAIGGALVGVGVVTLFVFPPLGLCQIGLGASQFAIAKLRREKK